ncbi:MarR family winged helix-turn-helix transcriptional regulator [Thermomonospora umbrina]|uniref:DNA-binding MarR family transcriptional regulator n=1 Tax=Thermomonospora umbrina TaxID=111806 RepID=A0A3D9SGP8_9ACTN|nr:MarR family transcriptional regulator [Thermomonospora umbrina]REE95086.1 DNA-binding MarR family transcriptional regulator [Thermomonospora umbrina]
MTQETHVGRLPVLRTAPGHLVRCAQQAHTHLWQRHVLVGLTSVQYGILLVLGQRGKIDQKTIGRLMSLDKSTTADVVSRLTRRGLVTRQRDPRDGRRRPVCLSARGRLALTQATPAVVQVQRRLLDPLGENDREDLFTLLSRVAYQGDPPRDDDPDAPAGEVDAELPQERLHRHPGHLIRRAAQLHTTLWSGAVSRSITSVQYSVLLALHDAPRLDQRMVGSRVSLDKSTGGDVVARLQERGWVERTRDTDDARRNLLGLTDEGRDFLFGRAEAVIGVQDELLAPLSVEERRRFEVLMLRVTRAHEEGD